MRNSIVGTIAISLLAAALAGCSKKEATPTAAPAAELPKDGVSSVPSPAERAADLAPVDLTVGGAIKEVKAKVLDKEADDKAKGLLRIKVLDLDGPIEVSDNTQWEVWKPGSDIEEQRPELTFWASSEQPVLAGTWDLRLRYQESPICKAEGWIRGVKVEPGKLWKAEAVLAAPMEYVRLYGTLSGTDLADNVRIDVFKAGTDQEEFQPLTSFWSTQKQAIAAGNYDLRLAYEKDNVKAKADVKGFAVGGDHGILKKTVVLAKM
jgi:hypothetical protein